MGPALGRVPRLLAIAVGLHRDMLRDVWRMACLLSRLHLQVTRARIKKALIDMC